MVNEALIFPILDFSLVGRPSGFVYPCGRSTPRCTYPHVSIYSAQETQSIFPETVCTPEYGSRYIHFTWFSTAPLRVIHMYTHV